jgi:prepilin-type N-terminal cleavage/methylation domain-containing protein
VNVKETQSFARRLSFIGRRQASLARGFTLIEIMVAVSLLAFGIVSIYEALFASLDAFSYYSNYLNVQTLANEKIWEIEDQILRSEIPKPDAVAGNFVVENHTFQWQTQATPLDEAQGLYDLQLTLSWKEGLREINISRETYAMTAPETKVETP